MDAAFGQIPVALAGDVAKQQLTAVGEEDDAATKAAASKRVVVEHVAIVASLAGM